MRRDAYPSNPAGSKSEGSAEIRVVVEAATADIGNIDPGPDFVLPGRPGDDVIQVPVVLGLQAIALRAAAGE